MEIHCLIHLEILFDEIDWPLRGPDMATKSHGDSLKGVVLLSYEPRLLKSPAYTASFLLSSSVVQGEDWQVNGLLYVKFSDHLSDELKVWSQHHLASIKVYLSWLSHEGLELADHVR